ncbi:NprX family peptide pheromone [Bacillus gaemokensis]|nr:NprX family peptide pheromone [Bacillus gaemokensis]
MKKVIISGFVLMALLVAVLEPQYGWRPDMSAEKINTVVNI